MTWENWFDIMFLKRWFALKVGRVKVGEALKNKVKKNSKKIGQNPKENGQSLSKF